MATQVESSIQLLVEGNDQRNFFEAMVEHMALSDVQVRNFGGVDELSGYLVGLVTGSNFLSIVRHIGIVRDAETSAASAFRSVQSSLRNAGLPVPAEPALVTGGEPSVSVLVLPDGADSGMLETLLCMTFAGTAVDRCIDGLFECANAAGLDASKRPEKARCRVWLAMKPEPHLSVGVAAKRGYWNLGDPALEGVRTFLMALCPTADAAKDQRGEVV